MSGKIMKNIRVENKKDNLYIKLQKSNTRNDYNL